MRLIAKNRNDMIKYALTKAEKIIDEIELIFGTAVHWNRQHPNEVPINPDPDGKLERIQTQLKKFRAQWNIKRDVL